MSPTITNKEIHLVAPEMNGAEKDPTLFFIHGAGGNAAIWDEQAAYFRGRHPVYRVELPGHGGSTASGEEKIGDYANRVRVVLEGGFSSRPYVLVGHSMGGGIVLDLALDPPPGVEGVVLVATGAKLAVTRAIFHMLEHDPQAFFETWIWKRLKVCWVMKYPI